MELIQGDVMDSGFFVDLMIALAFVALVLFIVIEFKELFL